MSFGFGFALPAYPLRGGGGNNPFNQSGPTLDLSFTGVVTDLTDPNGYTLNTNFIIPQYQIAAQYVVWETGVGLVDKTFSQIITFTRASTGTFFDSAGVLQTAAIDAPRFDYNPSTLAAQGFLVEEARTNSIRNNTMQGAVAGTPGTLPTNWGTTTGGLAIDVAGVGTENGITYVDLRFNGTSTGTAANVRFEQNTQIVAASGQAWTNSVFVRRSAGSTANITLIENVITGRDSGGTTLETFTSSIAATLNAAFINQNRQTLSATLANASTARIVGQINLTFSAGAAIDITLRIGLPQLEQGAFATSVIPTTTTALTRSADVASVNTLSPWYNATAGTLYTEVIAPQTFSYFPCQAMFHDGTASNYLLNDFATTGAPRFERAAGGVVAGVMNSSPVVSAGALVKQAAAFAVNDFALVANGGTPVTSATGNMPTVTTLRVGGYLNATTVGNLYNGYLRRIVYYPRRLSNAELQAITA